VRLCYNENQTHAVPEKHKGGWMKLPVYVTTAEVQRVCKELQIRDWTKLTEAKVLPEEAELILSAVNAEGMHIDPKEFLAGLEVEMEHGIRFKDANVTNNHPLLTGMIVLAHLKESLYYYKLLEVAELEGDLLKAVVAGDPAKIKRVYMKLANGKALLHKAEGRQLK
jgi:hypothetical protein